MLHEERSQTIDWSRCDKYPKIEIESTSPIWTQQNLPTLGDRHPELWYFKNSLLENDPHELRANFEHITLLMLNCVKPSESMVTLINAHQNEYEAFLKDYFLSNI